jgi:hypothetical protein
VKRSADQKQPSLRRSGRILRRSNRGSPASALTHWLVFHAPNIKENSHANAAFDNMNFAAQIQAIDETRLPADWLCWRMSSRERLTAYWSTCPDIP